MIKPGAMVIQEPVQAAVWQALNHYSYEDAIFLAERLHAEVHNDETLFILATCYYRSGKSIRAYLLLQGNCPSPQCKYLLARCCVDLNKLSEAEHILTGKVLFKNKTCDAYVKEYGDTACFILQLLATIYRQTERHQKAADLYQKSLKLNPFLWSSFEDLCNTGEKLDIPNIFKLSNVPCFTNSQIQQSNPVCKTSNVDNIVQANPPTALSTQIINQSLGNDLTTPNAMDISDIESPAMAPPTSQKPRPRAGRSLLGGPANLSPLTPSFGVLPLDTPSPGDNKSQVQFITPSPMNLGNPPPPPLLRVPRKAPPRGQLKPSAKPPLIVSGNTQTPSPQTGSQNLPIVRRSSRLFSNANSVKENNNKNQSRNSSNVSKAPAKKFKTRLSKTQELNELNKAELEPELKSVKTSTVTCQQTLVTSMQKQSAAGLMNLLQEMGKGYQALSQYNCKKAVELFTSLPVHHLQSGWVLCQVGKAYFEMADYPKAEKYFSEARKLEPYHFNGMEMYSTVLWHLQKDVALSALAQELTDLDKMSPEAWCATGNCFSLQKEHDVAIKFLQRAVQVNPAFAYAYTLLGHEYILIEEFDKAMSCFRSALRINSRHYNAWYGIGLIYYKQEKFSQAEVHLRKALSINPQSSVLMCHVGVIQHALKKSEGALSILNKAIAADPKNPLCKFHKASILLASDKYKEALEELEELKEIVPKESLVYFLIGKVHKMLGNTHLALMNFSWALDLDPKGANNQIKEAIDKRYVTDEDESLTEVNDTAEDTATDSSDIQPVARDLFANNSSLDEEEMQLEAIDESL